MALNYGSQNVAILSEKKYVLSEENNQCNVIKFLFLSIIFNVKLKKKLLQYKKEIILY